MAIIVLKAWYLESVVSLSQVQHTEPDLRLSRTGLLKTGMRADLLDDLDKVKLSRWYERYLEGGLVEFYIEGSGAYSISNLDLISREMYFNKRNTLTHIEPTLLFCSQKYYPESSQIIRGVLSKLVESINRSRSPVYPIQFEESNAIHSSPQTSLPSSAKNLIPPIDAALIRKIKHALIVVADVTPITVLPDPIPYFIPSPQVCVEVGYALQSRKPEEIILIQMERDNMNGRFPFEIENTSFILSKDTKQLQTQLSTQITKHLQRSRLIDID
jgi:hypothetical protein